jgi:hypothetical protein
MSWRSLLIAMLAVRRAVSAPIASTSLGPTIDRRHDGHR